jgi:phage terminase large subunit-like protein
MADLSRLNQEQKNELLVLLEEKARRKRMRKLDNYYPEEGKLSRHAYPKHMEFFRAGGGYRERLFLAANRVGKTEGAGGYEMTLHLTGQYPPWWEGRRFDMPIKGIAAGDTSKTVREVNQEKLLGSPGMHGTGLIPGDCILKTTPKPGIPDAVDAVWVKHVSGGHSMLWFKSYDQRREAFQGMELDVVWLDEEPPLEIYTECLIRTMTTNGCVMLTFTPLLGLSRVVLEFLKEGKLPDR